MYSLNFHKPDCTCKDWARHHIPCKHFFRCSKTFQNGIGKCFHRVTKTTYQQPDSNAVQIYTGDTEEGLPSDIHIYMKLRLTALMMFAYCLFLKDR